MKRISALICAMLMAVTLVAPACFAADKVDGDKAAKKELAFVLSQPEDGTEGVAVDNLSIKVKFDKDVKPANDNIKAQNLKQCSLKSSEGVAIPIQVYYSPDETGLILIAADIVNAKKDQQIKGDETYTFTIGKDFKAVDGSTLGQAKTISVTTLNQQRSMLIYMVLMFLMMGGMIFFTIRSQKKAEEKKAEENEKKEAVNPYKEAKRTGKTVAEVIQEEEKKKAKLNAKQQARAEELAQLEAQIAEEIRRAKNKKVKKPSPISAAGSNYKVIVKKTEKPVKTSGKNKKQVKAKGQSKARKRKK